MAFYPHLQPPRPEVRIFLDDIEAQPGDDAPRLVLADWLQDQPGAADRARGEFIYLQCLQSQPGVAPKGIRARLRLLLAEFSHEWLGPLAKLVDGWRFERGMLHLAIQGFRCFARELQELVHSETFAWVEGLTLRQVTGGFINVAEQLPLWRHVRSLTVEESRPGDPALRRLVALPALAGLRELNLAGCLVSARVVEHLSAHSHLDKLQVLDLTRNQAGGTGVEALALLSRLPLLRDLRLGYNLVPDDAVAALAQSPLLAQLHTLDLRGNQGCGGAGAAALVRSEGASNLRRLNLAQTRLRAETIEALLHSPALAGLRDLYLGRTNAGNEALKRLGYTESLPGLERLSLARNNVSDAGLQALAGGPSSRRLKALDLAHNHLDRDAAVALATSPAFEELRELDLEDNRIGDEGALALARSPMHDKLHFLDAGNNGLSALGKAVLLRRYGRKVALV